MRRISTIVQTLLALILLLYAGDWGMLHIRASRGTAYKTFQVEQYLSTPLKGNKAEYDYMGTQPQQCARSLFPQSGYVPCWWLARHTTRWE